MALGPGKYDKLCTDARKGAQAEGAALIILNGRFGHGFSVQASAEVTVKLPQLLREIAKSIEDTLNQGGA
jgi:hypothetical protein